MRHLLGIALAAVLAAALFFAGTWGYLRLQTGAVSQTAGGGSLLGSSSLVLALAALVASGGLAGVLVAVRRISPLAAGLPGLLLLAWTALYLVSARQAVQLIPLRAHDFGAGWQALLLSGLLGAAGAVLVIPLFLPSRWRALSAAGEDADATADYLSDVWPDTGQRRAAGRRDPAAPRRDARPGADRYREVPAAPRPRQAEPTVTETVLSGLLSGDVRPVDTTRVTGASRALRHTGSFRAAGETPRSTGSFPAPDDTSLLGRPYRRPE